MARRKTQNLWLVPCGTRAPLGAPRRRFRRPGRAFAVSVRRPGRAPKRWAGHVGIDLTVVSQLLAGLRSVPGGAPAPPGWLACEQAPRAPHLVPPFARFARAPLKRTRWMDDNGGLERGDKINGESLPARGGSTRPDLRAAKSAGAAGGAKANTLPGSRESAGRHPPLKGRDKKGRRHTTHHCGEQADALCAQD